jgi:hypothetical protein
MQVGGGPFDVKMLVLPGGAFGETLPFINQHFGNSIFLAIPLAFIRGLML